MRDPIVEAEDIVRKWSGLYVVPDRERLVTYIARKLALRSAGSVLSSTPCRSHDESPETLLRDFCNQTPGVSDGSSADYYKLPAGATELQHLISHRNMNGQDAEIFRTCYRKGRASHSDELRDAKKNRFYANAEVERLEAVLTKEKAEEEEFCENPEAFLRDFYRGKS